MRITEKIGKEVRRDSLMPGEAFLLDGELYMAGRGDYLAISLEDAEHKPVDGETMVIPVDAEVKWRFK